ncbi:MAG: hypothetical protein M3119_06875 [Verrucomicrobiota bacterium]|nr:hypothetical protein [Verrucomicrobiota bacterium]
MNDFFSFVFALIKISKRRRCVVVRVILTLGGKLRRTQQKFREQEKFRRETQCADGCENHEEWVIASISGEATRHCLHREKPRCGINSNNAPAAKQAIKEWVTPRMRRKVKRASRKSK